MVALVTLLIVLLLSLLVTRVATIALSATGLSREAARFQARSAFSGAGFTTSEAESVMNHPLRRRIIMVLILAGSAGLASAIASLLLSFGGIGTAGEGARRLGLLLVGLVALWLLARSRAADRVLTRVTERALRRFTRLDVRDYSSLLRLAEEWVVAELAVESGDWLADRTLEEADLPGEGVVVLGIQREDGRWVGAPRGTARVRAGDVVVLYGSGDTIAELDERKEGREGETLRDTSRARFSRRLSAQEEAEGAAEQRRRR